VHSKANISQLNLPHCKQQVKTGKTEKVKKDMLIRSIRKQSGESEESVLEKKRKATVGRIYRKGKF